MVHFVIYLVLGLCVAFANAFASGEPCRLDISAILSQPGYRGYLPTLLGRPKAQPIVMPYSGKSILFHNRQLLQILSDHDFSEGARLARKHLREKGTFEIPLNSRGVMVAAARGTYSTKAWIRDHLRGFKRELVVGNRERARSMILASLEQMAKRDQFERIKESLKNPNRFREINPRTGHTFGDAALPQVVFNAETLEDAEPWSVQKDAWGLYIHSVLDSLEAGLISLDELTSQQRAAFVGMVALMMRLQFWQFASTDSWEEEHHVYSSGLGIVTSALERVVADLKLDPSQSYMFRLLNFVQSDSALNDSEKAMVQEFTSISKLEAGVRSGYEVLRKQLKAGGEAPWMRGDRGRTADKALLWLFFYRLKDFTEDEYFNILKLVEKLVREAGMLRYEDPYVDGYLNPVYFLDSDKPIPEEYLQMKGQITSDEMRRFFYRRQLDELTKRLGTDFPAQWSLGLAVGLQAALSMRDWFPNSLRKSEYFDIAKNYAYRLYSVVSPEEELAVSLEGFDVPANKIGEAITRVSIFDKDSKSIGVFSVYSPFTQLNWAVAEADIGLTMLEQAQFR